MMWPKRRKVALWLPTVLLFLVSHLTYAEPVFKPLGMLPPGDTFDEPYSYPTGISADGSTVIGVSVDGNLYPRAFRWTHEDGMEFLGDVPGGPYGERARKAVAVSADGGTVLVESSRGNYYLFTPDGGLMSLEDAGENFGLSRATNLSKDGSTVVGQIYNLSTFEREAAVWSLADGWMGMGQFPGGMRSYPRDLTADGGTAIGNGLNEDLSWEAFVWTSADGIVGLGDLPGGEFYSRAERFSADGSTIVGKSESEAGDEAVVWTAEGGMIGLGDLPGGEWGSGATDLSSDGSVVVGWSYADSRSGAFVWTHDGGIEALANGSYRSIANAVSPDGSFVVGEVIGDVYDVETHRAFIWDESNGLRHLDDVLTKLGLNLGGWILTDANYISADGRVITGVGINPANGWREAWLAVIPQLDKTAHIDIKPGAVDNSIILQLGRTVSVAILGSDIFDVSEIDPATLAFGVPQSIGAAPKQESGESFRDIDHDGFLDLLSRYSIEETGIAAGDTEACVIGELLDGTPFEGCDAILVLSRCDPVPFENVGAPITEKTRVELLEDNRTVFARGELCDIWDYPPYLTCSSRNRDYFPDADFADWNHYLQQSRVGTHLMTGVGLYRGYVDLGSIWTNSVFDVVFYLYDRARVRLTGTADLPRPYFASQVVARLIDTDVLIYENTTAEGPTDLDFDKVLEPGRYQLQVYTDMIGVHRGTYDFQFAISATVAPERPAVAIKPGGNVYRDKPRSDYPIPVAILGSAGFDVGNIDISTLRFGPARAAPVPRKGSYPKSSLEICPEDIVGEDNFTDVNHDGYMDLVSTYRLFETGIAAGDVEACIRWEAYDGIPFEECDSIHVGRTEDGGFHSY